ncbi:MAG: hypothetical protein K6F25_10300 [Bacteroidales bacterium]|nr:hypothetical protein [Bacteroidales bacterium]
MFHGTACFYGGKTTTALPLEKNSERFPVESFQHLEKAAENADLALRRRHPEQAFFRKLTFCRARGDGIFFDFQGARNEKY